MVNISDLSCFIKTQKEMECDSNTRSIKQFISQGKLNDTLLANLNDSFKAMLSDSTEKDSVASKVQTANQVDADKRDVKKSRDDEERDLKDIEEPRTILQERFSRLSLVESDSIDPSLNKEAFTFGNIFSSRQELEQEASLDNLTVRPVGFAEPIAMQSTLAQLSSEGSQKVEQDLSLLHEGDTQIDFGSIRLLSNMQKDQRIEPSALKSGQLDQQSGMPKIIVSTQTPMQNITPLITPILLSNFDSANEIMFGIDSEGVEVGSVTGKPNSFVEASQHQKQLLNKDGEGGAEDGHDRSFDGKDGHAQQVSANSVDSVQKTVAVQKLSQVIRERALDAIEKSKSDMNLNVRGIQTTLGEVEMDLKIANKKISVRLSSDSKDIQTLLTQQRSGIEAILNGLIDSTVGAGYLLADIPVEVCHKEKEI